MNARLGVVIAMIVLIFPVVITSMLVDMTRRGYTYLLIACIITAFIYYTSSLPIGIRIDNYLAEGSHLDGVMLAAGSVIIAASIMAIYFRRRAYHRMEWPANMSQQKMERCGIARMRKDGWSVSEQASFAGTYVYDCRKDRQRVSVLFIKVSPDYERLLATMRTRNVTLFRLLILHYQRPNESSRDLIRLNGAELVHYKHLPTIDEAVARFQKCNSK